MKHLLTEAVRHFIHRLSVFGNRVVNHWNALPQDVVDVISVNDFKNKLDKHLYCEKFQYRSH